VAFIRLRKRGTQGSGGAAQKLLVRPFIGEAPAHFFLPMVETPDSLRDADGRQEPELTAQVYAELRRIAQVRLASQRSGHTLQATALVHEAYLKLQRHSWVFSADRARFFRAAAEAMRQILIDHARAKGRQKRGGGGGGGRGSDGDRRRAIVDVAQLAAEDDSGQIVALDEAIRRFEQVDARAAEVVKLRFFAGLSVEETADLMGLSVRTINREWKLARAWLYKALE
jgi:RNA polymerase sigma factor (TIGR02999 family)